MKNFKWTQANTRLNKGEKKQYRHKREKKIIKSYRTSIYLKRNIAKN